MKFISTKGREHAIDIRPSRWPRRPEGECKSKLQWGVSVIIDELYPYEAILEEFFVPGDSLYIDFFLPRKRLAVEVHGRQHYEYSEFFHGSKKKFKQSQERDSRKKHWCELNGIKLIEIAYDDKEDSIRSKLKGDTE